MPKGKRPGKLARAKAKTSKGFTAEERAAMRERRLTAGDEARMAALVKKAVS